MRFRILGPLRLTSGPGGPVALPGAAKPRVVLGTLLARANTVVSVEDLVDEVWPAAPPRTATTTLQVYVSQVRKVLRSLDGGCDGLETAAPGYVLRVGPQALDAVVFEELVERAGLAAAGGDAVTASALYRRAARLWRGPLLADVPRGMLLDQAARRLEEVRVTALDQRVRADLRLGRHREVVAELQSLVADHPAREEFHGLLMRALYRSGRQTEALEVFGALRRAMVNELGVEPGPQVRQLQARILAGDRRLLRPDDGVTADPATAAGSPAARAADPASVTADRAAAFAAGPAVPGSGAVVVPGAVELAERRAERAPADDLPPPDALFTGRSVELARLEALLGSGAAGAGAVLSGAAGSGKTALAVETAHRLADVFPDGRILVELPADGGPLASAAVAAAVGGDAGSVAGALRGRRVLLVLDGAVSPEQVRPLLPAQAGCAVLVTLRRRVAGPDGLTTVPVGALPAADSLRLLERSAGAPADRAAASARAEIAEACGHLPAALRIAAGLLTARSHRHDSWLAERLRAPGERLDRLRFGGLDIRVPLAAGYAAATAPERRALRLLALLPAEGFGVPLAAAVLGLTEPEALWALEELADACLLQPRPGGGAGAAEEFRIPCPARLLAVERLTEEEPPEEVRSATARLCEAVADAPGSAGRSTLSGLVSTAYAAGLWRLTVRLADAVAPALERDAAWQEWREAHGLALEAAGRAGDGVARARFLRSLGDLAWQRREVDRAEELFREAAEAARSAGAPEEFGRSLVGLAELRLDTGALAEAAELLAPALAAVAGPAHGRGRFEASRAMGLLALERDAPAAAEGYFAQCLELAGVLDDRRLEAFARRALRSARTRTAAGGRTSAGGAGRGLEIRPGMWRLPPPAGCRVGVER